MSEWQLNPDDAGRRRAEALVSQIPENIADLSSEKMRRLLRELRVHQIELGMQNEELRRIQIELEESRSRYVDLYDLAPVGYVTLDEQGIILEANLTLVRMLGVAREDVLEQSFLEFVVPADQSAFDQHWQQLFALEALKVYEVQLLRANGTSFWAQLEATKQHNSGDTPTGRVIISDVSERKQAGEALQESHRRQEEALDDLQEAQAKLVQQERMAAIGQLAAGVAHDFNNILGIITLYAELILNAPDLAPQLQKRLGIISDQTQRAAHLVEQMLDFGRRSVLRAESLDLIPFLEGQVDIWRRVISGPIKIHFDKETDGETIIDADPTRLQQMFTNLVFNARDAMPNGGELRVTLGRCTVDSEHSAPLPDMPPGDWIEITVSDTGTGIPAVILPRIFEPFLSTKAPGKGSGLGLAQVYGIVKQHYGHIDVQTELGRGTTFTICLPALVTTQPGKTAADRASLLPKGNGETILVVEDEDDLREALTSTLDMLNYRVLTAAHGGEALAILERSDEPASDSEALGNTIQGQSIALILTDFVMPDMDGKALFQALQERGVTVPVIILSGMATDRRAPGVAGWLLKPIDTEELATAVARAIERGDD